MRGARPWPTRDPGTDGRSPLAEVLTEAGDGDVLPCGAETVLQMLTTADVEGPFSAGRHERTGDRPHGPTGFRDRRLCGASDASRPAPRGRVCRRRA